MKIFDCTTFYNEKLMMDVRFNVLNEYISKFIVVESLFSHSGEKKKLNFDINDYPKFKDKINYIIIEKEPENLLREDTSAKNTIKKRSNSIKRIEQSYDYMLGGLKEALDDDLIMLSDNDEIPKLDSLNLSNLKNNFFVFE